MQHNMILPIWLGCLAWYHVVLRVVRFEAAAEGHRVFGAEASRHLRDGGIYEKTLFSGASLCPAIQ